jgi:hypothetical protein
MSRYSRWGFFKNKHNAGTLANADNFYPRYPDLPSSNIFYTFIKAGYLRTSDPIANVNLTLGAPLHDGSVRVLRDMQYTMPDGNIAFPTVKRTGISPSFTYTAELFKYDADAGNITKLNPTVGPLVADDLKDATTGCLTYDGNVNLYVNRGIENVEYIKIKTDYSAMTHVNTHSNYPGPILPEDTFPIPQKCIALENNKVMIFSEDVNSFANAYLARAVIHDLATDKFSNTTFQYDGVNSFVTVSGTFDLNVVQVPGSQSVGSESGNIYVIPQEGFLLNGEPGSGTVPALDGPRCIVEFDPGANVTTRFTPSGADLTTPGFNKDDKLYVGSTLGVDGNVYAFPGEIKKDIMVLDPSNRSATQSTFGIFNTTGANTIQCFREAITAPDGYAYIRARGVQPDHFTGTQDFWLSIDTNPTSNTYQTGSCIPIDPDGIYTNENEDGGLVVAKDGLIMSQPGTTKMMTVQVNTNAGYPLTYHPALLNNIND